MNHELQDLLHTNRYIIEGCLFKEVSSSGVIWKGIVNGQEYAFQFSQNISRKSNSYYIGPKFRPLLIECFESLKEMVAAYQGNIEYIPMEDLDEISKTYDITEEDRQIMGYSKEFMWRHNKEIISPPKIQNIKSIVITQLGSDVEINNETNSALIDIIIRTIFIDKNGNKYPVFFYFEYETDQISKEYYLGRKRYDLKHISNRDFPNRFSYLDVGNIGQYKWQMIFS